MTARGNFPSPSPPPIGRLRASLFAGAGWAPGTSSRKEPPRRGKRIQPRVLTLSSDRPVRLIRQRFGGNAYQATLVDKVLASISRRWDNVKGLLTVRSWFKQICEAIDVILDSLIQAVGAGGIIKEFKDALSALAKTTD
jgi:hypothetical protein